MYDVGKKLPKELNKYCKSECKLFLDFLKTKEYIKSITPNRERLASISLKVFFANSVNPILSGRNSFGVTLRSSVYSAGEIYNGTKLKESASYTYTLWLFEYLEYSGYGVLVKGGKIYEKSKGFNKVKSWILKESTSSYFEFNRQSREKLYNLYLKISKKPEDNVLFLRNKDKVNITFKTNKASREKRDKLINFNKHSISYEIGSHDKDVTYDVQLRRIFNMNFDKGGRHYCGTVQNLSKSERKKVTINGNPCSVYDFKSFEPSIAYTLNGEVMDGDPYQVYIEGYDDKVLREVGKMILTRMLYADSRSTVLHSVNSDIQSKFNLTDLVCEGKIPEKRIPVGKIIDEMMIKHENISNYFYNKGDNDLQYIGGEIMDYILEYFMQNYGKLVIPVFDEIIVESEMDYVSIGVMEKAYNFVLGDILNCNIVKEN